MSLDGLRLVLDCSHGATFQAAPDVFSRLGAEISVLSDKPDGVNINAGCGSQHPEALAKAVVKHKAHAGFAFDGDGDRVIAVDETGGFDWRSGPGCLRRPHEAGRKTGRKPGGGNRDE